MGNDHSRNQGANHDEIRSVSLQLRAARRRLLSAFILVIAIAGCAPGRVFDTLPPDTATRAIANTEAPTSLFVADSGSITVYGLAKGHYVRRISDPSPTALTTDREGNLFVADFDANTVTVYARGTGSVLRVITQGLHEPRAVALDSAGNLYVANHQNNTVTVYSPGSESVLRTISEGLNGPHALIFARNGDLFVGSNGSGHITVYPPGGVHVVRTVVTHNGPLALGINQAGDLFSVNNFNITVYKPGHTSPDRIISDGIDLPSTLAFDSNGNLYVANWGPNMLRSFISIYPPGGSMPTREISRGISNPLSLALISNGSLIVANAGSNTVSEYGPAGRLERTITSHVRNPSAIAIGP